MEIRVIVHRKRDKDKKCEKKDERRERECTIFEGYFGTYVRERESQRERKREGYINKERGVSV